MLPVSTFPFARTTDEVKTNKWIRDNFIRFGTEIRHMEDSPRGVEAWKEHTTAFDRVRSIAEALDQARSAKYIAEEAAVSETTAHNHLKRLAEMNVIRTVADENATYYEPDPLYGRFRTLRGLIENHTHQELLELKADLQRADRGLYKNSTKYTRRLTYGHGRPKPKQQLKLWNSLRMQVTGN